MNKDLKGLIIFLSALAIIFAGLMLVVSALRVPAADAASNVGDASSVTVYSMPDGVRCYERGNSTLSCVQLEVK